MGNFTLNYTGNAINGWGQRIAELEEETSTLQDQFTQLSNENTMTFGQRVNISLSNCNTNAVSACKGFYEVWGPFVYVYVGIKVSPATTANTMTTLCVAGTFPTPECNSPDAEDQGYAALSENRGTYPYVRYDGSLYISGSSASVPNNVIIFINGFYRRLITSD